MRCASSTLPLNIELHGADSRGRLLTVAHSINGADAESLGLYTTFGTAQANKGQDYYRFLEIYVLMRWIFAELTNLQLSSERVCRLLFQP